MINIEALENLKIDEMTAHKIATLKYEKQKRLLSMQYSNCKFVWQLNYAEIVQIEFELQEAWGFKADSKYHNLVGAGIIPHCTCPHIDNLELIGVAKDIIYNDNCPIHGIEKDEI